MYRSRTVLLTVQRFEFSWLKYSCSRAIYSKAIPVRKTIFKANFIPPPPPHPFPDSETVLPRCPIVSTLLHPVAHDVLFTSRPCLKRFTFWKRRQNAGRLPSTGDTALQPRHYGDVPRHHGSVHWYLLWFMYRNNIPPPPAQSIHDIVSLVAEPNWASVRFRQ